MEICSCRLGATTRNGSKTNETILRVSPLELKRSLSTGLNVIVSDSESHINLRFLVHLNRGSHTLGMFLSWVTMSCGR